MLTGWVVSFTRIQQQFLYYMNRLRPPSDVRLIFNSVEFSSVQSSILITRLLQPGYHELAKAVGISDIQLNKINVKFKPTADEMIYFRLVSEPRT